ncbi:IS630 family transposase [Azohydromonas sp. G-1-1-14]|uniref:IS630 family transposase n=1 Tax=Azohydromonas caseinilytica TaxID=2728836 RepID=A0A848FG50_9BURK|nr:IS630 family transposase [Azohydromonas caseinilytica]
MKRCWCIQPKANAEFVCRMEDVLDVYQRPHDPASPWRAWTRPANSCWAKCASRCRCSRSAACRQDCEYERHGTANMFVLYAPLEGWRHVDVTERRTAVDFAHVIKDLVDVHFPRALRIVLVMDNLNTHGPASLYEAFAPVEARRLAAKLEIHYTPKHGSWLDMAELELSILARQCLGKRMDSRSHLASEVAAWEDRRNASHATIDWRFTTADTRIKLKRLYPAVQL